MKNRKKYDRKYYLNNIKKCNAASRKWQKANPTKVKIIKLRYRKNNLEECRKERREYQRQYRIKYPERVRETRRKCARARPRIDAQSRLRQALRSRLSHAIKGKLKRGSFVKDLGCTIDELKIYLEKLFQPGMSWNNYGKWHLDHKHPLASFNLLDKVQFLKAAHYTNLQPLWAHDNLVKKDKILYE